MFDGCVLIALYLSFCVITCCAFVLVYPKPCYFHTILEYQRLNYMILDLKYINIVVKRLNITLKLMKYDVSNVTYAFFLPIP